MAHGYTLRVHDFSPGAKPPVPGQVYASMELPDRWFLHLGNFMDPVFTMREGTRTIAEKDGTPSWWPTCVLTLLGKEQETGDAWERFSIGLTPLEALSILPDGEHARFLDTCEELALTSVREVAALPVATAHGHAERRRAFLASVRAAREAWRSGTVPGQRKPTSFIPPQEDVKPDLEGSGGCPVPAPFLAELRVDEGVMLGCGRTGRIPWMARDGGGWITESGTYVRPGVFVTGKAFPPDRPGEPGRHVSLLGAACAYPASSRAIILAAARALKAAEKARAAHPLLERLGLDHEIAFARAEIREVRAYEKGALAAGQTALPTMGDVYMTTSSGMAIGMFTPLTPTDPLPQWVPMWGKVVTVPGKGSALASCTAKEALAQLTPDKRREALHAMAQVMQMSRAALARRALHLPTDPGTALLSDLVRTAGKELRSEQRSGVDGSGLA